MNMLNLNKISRQQWNSAVFILLCCGAGALGGRYSVMNSLSEMQREKAKENSQSELAFVLPVSPPEKKASYPLDKGNFDAGSGKEPKDAAKEVMDLTELRIWELAVKQPLPPRKEPLTSPRWRVVGVTSVGSEKSVLLLFENQPATEVRKVGDKLPGGAKIIEIAQDHLRISLNGQLMNLNLRKQ